MSARSFKVFPESSLPMTARLPPDNNDFYDFKQETAYNTPRKRDSDDVTDETSVPQHTGLAKSFKINNSVMLNKIQSVDKLKGRLGINNEA
jgi:hypothetical protein